MEIRAAGPGQEPVAVAVTMRTPGPEAELAVGFLRTEGLIDGPRRRRTSSSATRRRSPSPTTGRSCASRARSTRRSSRSATSSRRRPAGSAARRRIDEIAVRCDAAARRAGWSPREVILSLPDRLRAAQRAFESTGGLHASGLFDAGRRAARRCARTSAGTTRSTSSSAAGPGRPLPLHDRVLLVSGRVSFEIVQKAAVAGIADPVRGLRALATSPSRPPSGWA